MFIIYLPIYHISYYIYIYTHISFATCSIAMLTSARDPEGRFLNPPRYQHRQPGAIVLGGPGHQIELVTMAPDWGPSCSKSVLTMINPTYLTHQRKFSLQTSDLLAMLMVSNHAIMSITSSCQPNCKWSHFPSNDLQMRPRPSAGEHQPLLLHRHGPTEAFRLKNC